MSNEQSNMCAIPTGCTNPDSDARIVNVFVPGVQPVKPVIKSFEDNLVEAILGYDELTEKIVLASFKKDPEEFLAQLNQGSNQVYDYVVNHFQSDMLKEVDLDDLVQIIEENMTEREIREKFLQNMDLSDLLEEYTADDILKEVSDSAIEDYVNEHGSFSVSL